jgi:hypothetical protein
MRAPAIFVGLAVGMAVGLWAPRANADQDSDAASLAESTCRDPAAVPGVVDAGKAVVAAQAAVATAQAARDAAAQAAKQAVATGSPKVRQAAAADEAARQAELDGAIKAAGDAAKTLAIRQDQAPRLCGIAWSGYAGMQYPIGFLQTMDPDICTQLKSLSSLDDRSTAEELCSGVLPRSGPGFGTAGINLVLGVGDLLQAEAKQEVLEYLIDQIGKRFCAYKHDDIDLGAWFAHTCAKIAPPPGKPGAKPDAKPDAGNAVQIGDIKEAFDQDVKELPHNVGDAAHAWLKKRWPGADPYLAVAGAVAVIVFDLTRHKKPIEIFEHLGTIADGATKQVLCDLTNTDDADQQQKRKACAALMLFQLARTGAQAYHDSETRHVSVILQKGLVAFCAAHGVAGKKENGACVIEPKHYDKWHARLLEFWRAARQMLELQDGIDKAKKTALPGELDKRAAPEVIAALRELVRTLAVILEALSPADKARLVEDAAVIDFGLDIYEALVVRDPAELRKAVLGLLKSPMLGDKLPARTVKAITVIVSLGTAKDRAEVKEILADVVDSTSSYKAKYGADHVIVAVNGFVGFFAGGELRLHARSAAGAEVDAARARAPFKLATPIGLDLTLWSWNKAHLGVFLSAIDPLALEVSDTGGTLHADWVTLFVPGAFLRVGGWRSPFSLAVGASYAVGRRSTDRCGSDRCFDGALQLGAFLSVDVPLLTLH